jgi:aryl-alcohol dehydrogenase-like predicted oxidoreductase
MLHSPGDLLHEVGNELYVGMQACKEQGLVRSIGVSVYAPSELEAILPRYPMDIVQAPLNIIDRRLEVSGWLSRLHDSGVRLYVRSIFLQGLLLMGADQRPDKFSRWNSLWTEWHDWLDKNKLSALKACLDFVLSFPEVERVLVGVDSSKQLSNIIECLSDERHLPPLSLTTEDPDLVNPSRWSAL